MHLYLHIPFCHRICPYCAFFKHTPGATDMRGFVQAVCQEAKLRLPVGFAPRTIYFGGGTPSMLSPTHLQALVEGLREAVDFRQVEEWSFEANPATFTPAKARQWRELGVTRVSLGAQSFEPDLLRLLGRTHTPEQIEESVRMLREAGMEQVNLDLMFSLPGQSPAQWEHTLQKALELRTEHISTYNLTYEEDTDFFRRFGASGTDEETDIRMFQMAEELLTGAGFRHYEISNYAREGCLSLHNLSCWRGEDYFGLGPGACASVDGLRYANAPDTTRYIAALTAASPALPPGTVEALTPEQRRTERIGLALRTDEGLPRELLEETPDWQEKRGFTEMLQREGLAVFSPARRLVLTGKGRLVADEIAVGLL